MTDQEKQEMEAESLGLDPEELEPITRTDEEAQGTYEATTTAGETVTIVSKRPEGQTIVLISDQGADYVADPHDNGNIRRFNPEVDGTGDGNSTEPAEGDLMGPSADATDAAEARKELDEQSMEDGVDATDAAEAKAALEGDLAQKPLDQPEPEATEAAEELAEEKGVDLSEVEGTGKDGKITKPDVEAALENDGAED